MDIEKTVESLQQKGYEVQHIKTGPEALEKIKEIIPPGASVMNGSSATLSQIGFLDLLKGGNHGWRDLHALVTAESDKAKRDKLRQQMVHSDYYLGSVHALIENGEFILASNSGSQLPHIVFTSPNLVFVVSTKKIVANFDEGMKRLIEHVLPLEEKQMKELYNAKTAPNKVLIFKGEKVGSTRKITFILVDEDLGF